MPEKLMETGTDTTKFRQVAEIQIWKDVHGNYDLWIGNTLYHCKSKQEVLEIIERNS
ncbi:hypothetical protein ES703_53989 [subsurface metagenome]